jgi:hypothetical protein
MAEHPCKGMTKAQIAVFERIAVNEPPYANHQTMRALRQRGVIDYVSEVVSRDALGPITVPRWFVPLSVHAQWCEWCGEQQDPDNPIGEDGDQSGTYNGSRRKDGGGRR